MISAFPVNFFPVTSYTVYHKKQEKIKLRKDGTENSGYLYEHYIV